MSEIPTQISFRNMDKPQGLEERIHGKVAGLARFHRHILRCRVTVEARHHSQTSADAFRIGIVVAVPGTELVVEHVSPRHEELTVAIHGAFDDIRRRIEDHNQRQHAIGAA
jgi:ribosome-associated translation inhibitor RaiA